MKKSHKKSRIRRAIRKSLWLISPKDDPFLLSLPMPAKQFTYEWPCPEGVTKVRGL